MGIQAEIVTALASVAGGRVYPQVAPQSAAKPFVVYRMTGSDPLMTIDSVVHITRYSFVFDCWAGTAQSALDIAASLRTALEIDSLKWVRDPAPENGYSPESDEYVESVAYSFWQV